MQRSRRRAVTLVAASLGLVMLAWLMPGAARAEDITAPAPGEPPGVAGCLDCHADPDESMVREGRQISVHVDPAEYRESVHGIVPCIRCHAEAAGTAHAENPEVPLGLSTGRPLRAEMSERCVKCHAGLYSDSYNASFHGVAVRHGDLRTATCVDCHGVHNIFSADDARSTVASDTVAATCASPGCHPTASPGFADGTEHFLREVKDTSPPLYWTWKFFIALILFDVMKDGPIVMFELLRRVRG